MKWYSVCNSNLVLYTVSKISDYSQRAGFNLTGRGRCKSLRVFEFLKKVGADTVGGEGKGRDRLMELLRCVSLQEHLHMPSCVMHSGPPISV